MALPPFQKLATSNLQLATPQLTIHHSHSLVAALPRRVSAVEFAFAPLSLLIL
jgi:hypothetical protein